MGQKVHPKIFRIGILYQGNSKWFSKKQYAAFLKQDIEIREYLKNKLKEARIAKIEIERSANAINIIIHTSRPGVVIGRGGKGIEELRKELQSKFLDKKLNINNVNIDIQEVSKPGLNAELVMQNMVDQIEKRVPYRKVMKRAIDQVKREGAQGVKVMVSGRLNGAEIARSEKLAWGKIPLHTLRADIDYAQGTARTTYGSVGVKVWICKGEVLKKGNKSKS